MNVTSDLENNLMNNDKPGLVDISQSTLKFLLDEQKNIASPHKKQPVQSTSKTDTSDVLIDITGDDTLVDDVITISSSEGTYYLFVFFLIFFNFINVQRKHFNLLTSFF